MGAEVDELKEHKKQLEEIVTPITTKLYRHDGSASDPPQSSHKHDENDV